MAEQGLPGLALAHYTSCRKRYRAYGPKRTHYGGSNQEINFAVHYVSLCDEVTKQALAQSPITSFAPELIDQRSTHGQG